jgi:hypothetical protein
MQAQGVSNFASVPAGTSERRQLMKRDRLAAAAVVALAALCGFSAACAAGAPRPVPRPDSSTIVHRASGQDEDLPELLSEPPLPLWIETGDLGFGASVVFKHIPNTRDLTMLSWVENLRHVILTLPKWPDDWNDIAPLAQVPLPEGADLIVILPGYPVTHGSAEVWNLLRRPLRIVMVVDGAPPDRALILEMNAMRGLERVIVDMPRPSRAGFERLQRPLSFRVIAP